MKTARLPLEEKHLETFKNALNDLTGLNYVIYFPEEQTVVVEYKWDHNLYCLGKMVEIHKQLNQFSCK